MKILDIKKTVDNVYWVTTNCSAQPELILVSNKPLCIGQDIHFDFSDNNIVSFFNPSFTGFRQAVLSRNMFNTINKLVAPTNKYERHSIHKIEDIIPLICGNNGNKTKVTLTNGLICNVYSLRLRTFRENQTCVCCGIEGKFFAAERTMDTVPYHLNMYGYDEHGSEVLFTKDHILPKSRGGKDSLKNLQTMCVNCNQIKGNNERFGV